MPETNENEVASPITIMIVVIVFLGFSYAVLSNKTTESQTQKIEYDEIRVENSLIESGKIDNSSVSIQSSSIRTNNDCLIKGNIGKDGTKIYHLPSAIFYEKTSIDISAGERWFCNEEDAVNAGWRKEEASYYKSYDTGLEGMSAEDKQVLDNENDRDLERLKGEIQADYGSFNDYN